MSVSSEDTGRVMRPIVRENWRSVSSEAIRARQVCGNRMESFYPGVGAIILINGTSSYLCRIILFFVFSLVIS